MLRITTALILLLSPAMLSADTFLYVSDAGNQRIVIYKIDNESGKLTPVDEVDVKAAPGPLVADPTRKYLFASLRSSFQIASFRIAKSGKLEPINTVSLQQGANATYLATDHTGKYLFSASYAGGRVVAHELGADGKIGRQIQLVETTKTAHSTVVPRDNRWVFVPHVAPNAIYQFSLDAATGQLTQRESAKGGKDGAGPRHLAFHPSQSHAFTSDETGSSITLYAYHKENGLEPLKTLSTLPAGFTGNNTTAEVKVHPNGKLVWVSNRGHDSLAGFRFDERSGELTAIGHTPSEKTPRSFEIVPSGDFLLAAGEGSGKLAAYRIKKESGQLDPIATYDVGKSLTWVAAVQQ